ncbi:sensor histidine kinase [Chondrinema litorale]|uniref:sensor histidine kinase n=1 Tax=Chondrinema litorale TaxID=2994555 RepID=UPI002542A506|nr:sensor histidine kinase [Chondrinema litorale]UZR94245.1 sensor histidine kinase [Chondrinema litorale]
MCDSYAFANENLPELKLSYFEDTSEAIDIDSCLSNDINFQPIATNSVNFGKNSFTYWIKAELIFSDSIQKKYFLEIDYPSIDYIDYFYEKNIEWHKVETGSLRPYNNRLLHYETFIFPVENNELRKTLYFKVKTANAIILRFNLFDQEGLIKEVKSYEMYYGSFFGIICIIIIINLIIFFFLKERSFIIYVFYVSFNLLLNVFLSGHISALVLRNVGGWYNVAYLQVLLFTILFGLWFAYEFLKLNNEKKFLQFVYFPLVGFTVLVGFISFYVDFLIINSLLEFNALAFILFMMFAAFIRYSKGHRAARFYIIGYLFYFLFLIPVILENYHLFERSFITIHGAEIGILLESTLLSIALIDRSWFEKKKITDERGMIYEENLKLQHQLHFKLEKQVQERTEELAFTLQELNAKNEEILSQRDNIESQKERLVKLNDNKDKFISILAHDVRGPINSMFAFTQLLANNINLLSREELVTLGRDLEKQTKSLYSLLDNLLQWARSQMGTLETYKEKFILRNQISLNINQLEGMAAPKNISIINNSENVFVFGDKNLFDTVMRNLISNAIKFSNTEKEIFIDASVEQNFVTISVKDEGLGFTEDIKDKLFRIETKHTTTGTKGEKGTGLGLKLCKEFAEVNGGKIWAESELYKGTVFYFTIPLFKENNSTSH